MKALRPWPYFVVYTLLFIIMCAYLWKLPAGISNTDTDDYLAAWQAIADGRPDIERTPVYPLILGGFRALLGPAAGILAVILLQWTALFIAVYYFRRTAARLTGNSKATFWATAVFALTPSVYLYGSALLTEGLAMSAVVFMTYCFANSGPDTRKNSAYTLGAMAWLCFLIYLRPVFIYMLPVSAVFFALLYLRYRRRALHTVMAGGSALLLIVASIAVYTALNRSYNGVSVFSYISTINNYCGLRQAGFIEPDRISDPSVQQALRTVMDDSARVNAPDIGAVVFNDIREVKAATRLCGHAAMKNYVDSLIKARPLDCIGIIVYRIDERIDDYPAVNIMPMCLDIVQIPLPRPFIKDVLMLLLLYLGAELYMMLKRKQWAPIRLMIIFTALGLMCASITGAMDEYNRLFLPAYSSFVLASTLFIRSLALSRKEMKWLR